MTKPGKLYGGAASFETGPARKKPMDYQQMEKCGPKPAMETGPGRMNPNMMGDIGKKNQAKGTMTSGTKGDQKGEDSGGSAY